jgi:hypothetical protein
LLSIRPKPVLPVSGTANLLILTCHYDGSNQSNRAEEEANVKLPIDTSAIAFLCAMPPEPVVDFETRRPKADENGEPLYVIQLLVMGEDSADLIAVKVPGVPSQAIRQGAPVKVAGLVAQPWTMADRSGVSFRAARVEPAIAQAKAS